MFFKQGHLLSKGFVLTTLSKVLYNYGNRDPVGLPQIPSVSVQSTLGLDGEGPRNLAKPLFVPDSKMYGGPVTVLLTTDSNNDTRVNPTYVCPSTT